MRHTRKSGGKSRGRGHADKSRRRHHRRGGNIGSAIESIAKDFGLVKQTYGHVVGKFLDDDVEDLRGYMEENENDGTLVPNAFFFGKTKDGEHVVIVSKHADDGLLKRLHDLPGDTEVYVTDTDVEYSMGDGWDHAADTGLVQSRSFGLSGTYDNNGVSYDIGFALNGSYSESEDPRANKRGSWTEGAGSLTVAPEYPYREAPEKTRKLAVASMASLERMGLDTDLVDEVADKLRLQKKGRALHRKDLRITESSLYLLSGDLGNSFNMSSETEERLSDAREEHERMLPLMDARLREDEEQRRQWEEDMSRPHRDDDYDDYRYGYGYDDGLYGGRRRRATRSKRGRHSKAKRSTRRR
jgi:hypothetical protein